MEATENNNLLPAEIASRPVIPKDSKLARLSLIFGLFGFLVTAAAMLMMLIAASVELGDILFFEVLSILFLAFMVVAFTGVVISVIALVKIRRRKAVLRGTGSAVSGLIFGAIPVLFVAVRIIYNVFFSAAGTTIEAPRFAPDKYQGPMGAINVSYQGESSLYAWTSEIKLTEFPAISGVIIAPTGTLQIAVYEMRAKDRKNNLWAIRGYPGSSREINIKINAAQNLNIGPPLASSVTVNKLGDNEVTFRFVIKGNGDGIYYIGPSTPAFQVVSEKGQILWQGKFVSG